MNAVFVEVVPIGCGDDVAKRVEEIVCHHLGLARCAACEIHERCVAVDVDVLRTLEFGCVFNAFVEVVPALWNFRTYGDAVLHGGAFRHGVVNVLDHYVVAHCHYGLDVGRLAAIHDVVFSEHVGGGNDHSTELVECRDGKPELVAALHDEHHHVAVAYAELAEIGGGLVALTLYVAKSELVVLSLVVDPQQCVLVGGNACPFIDHVVGKIEVFGNFYVEVLFEVFV